MDIKFKEIAVNENWIYGLGDDGSLWGRKHVNHNWKKLSLPKEEVAKVTTRVQNIDLLEKN